MNHRHIASTYVTWALIDDSVTTREQALRFVQRLAAERLAQRDADNVVRIANEYLETEYFDHA